MNHRPWKETAIAVLAGTTLWFAISPHVVDPADAATVVKPRPAEADMGGNCQLEGGCIWVSQQWLHEHIKAAREEAFKDGVSDTRQRCPSFTDDDHDHGDFLNGSKGKS